ncbi:hypothetical protein GJ496_009978 [Pomphorhynchus laevis]|nr:hypothetical protein GJ496_009978 [Pomphorhynchus laevis]
MSCSRGDELLGSILVQQQQLCQFNGRNQQQYNQITESVSVFKILTKQWKAGTIIVSSYVFISKLKELWINQGNMDESAVIMDWIR